MDVLSSYEKFRNNLLDSTIVSMIHLGIGTFEDLNSKVVQSVSFVNNKCYYSDYCGRYDRLFEKQGLQGNNKEKEKWLLEGNHSFYRSTNEFLRIPGSPLAYWISDSFINTFHLPQKVSLQQLTIGQAAGNKTANNDIGKNKALFLPERVYQRIHRTAVGKEMEASFVHFPVLCSPACFVPCYSLLELRSTTYKKVLPLSEKTNR